jgi:ATP-dependent Clp protease ATP-binding subunit ClpA
MNNFSIYYGPTKGFNTFLQEKKIDISTITTFSKLVRKIDEESREYRHIVDKTDEKVPAKEPQNIEYLVAYSDEYASAREHVIINFEGFLSNYNIENIIFHNPPEILSSKIINLFENTKIYKYEYSSITKSKILEINNEYSDVIIGQESVKKYLLKSLFPLVRDSYKRPIILLFYGPSGVGKTETAKFLSLKLGGDLFRKQLSMFQNSEFINYLFGGFHYEKSFAKDLLERETNVILLDEFDKAHNVTYSAFYQLFDEGIFVDKNYNVKIGKSIIICTSNYNSLEEIRSNLGDPIFSRIDTCIKFSELSDLDVRKIIRIKIDQEYNCLDPSDQSIIDKENINSLFEKYLGKLKNVRSIESLVREVISEKLLYDLIENS